MSTTARQAVLGEGLCLCHLGALRLQASIKNSKEVLFANYTSGVSECNSEQKYIHEVYSLAAVYIYFSFTDLSCTILGVC